MKIKRIEIKGIRGIRDKIELRLNSNSCLIFGENGAGKSSFVDAIEWFYYDKVGHLSREEIDKKGGITAIRNVHMKEGEDVYILLEFTNDRLNCCKSMSSTLRKSYSNNSDEFYNYINNSKEENLILRYEDLSNFINSTPKENLDNILNIIGFEDVLKTKDLIKRITNDLKREFKNRKFKDEISKIEGELMKYLGEVINDDVYFVSKVNDLLASKNLPLISSISDIDDLYKIIKEEDSSKVLELDFLEKSKNMLLSIKEYFLKLYKLYEDYYLLYRKLSRYIEIIKQLLLEKIWKDCVDIIENNFWIEDKCPLCFQVKNKNELLQEVKDRLREFQKVGEDKNKLDDMKKSIEDILKDIKKMIFSIENNRYYEQSEYYALRNYMEQFQQKVTSFQDALKKDLMKQEMISSLQDLIVPGDVFDKAISFCETRYNMLHAEIKKDEIWEIYKSIFLSFERYKEIKKLKEQEEKFNRYISSFINLYNAFLVRLKGELENFLSCFSEKLNEYYSFMHPGENIKNIRLKLVEDEDELKGLNIEYDFYGQNVSSPKKYLSESHMNSLGIALFLTSIEAFNKENKFFILDDVVSSFDVNHRLRLGQLLVEKSRNYQIIVFTHEKDWFSIMKKLVKNKNWYIGSLKWDEERGTYLETDVEDLEKIIEEKIKIKEVLVLGNLIRQYLEGFLKDIAESLEVNMPYRSNERNEQRSCSELISYIIREINRQPSRELFSETLNDLKECLFVVNKGSHNESFSPSIGDCKAYWEKVKHLKSLFFCENCGTLISTRYYDNKDKRIKCKCGNLKYEWRE